MGVPRVERSTICLATMTAAAGGLRCDAKQRTAKSSNGSETCVSGLAGADVASKMHISRRQWLKDFPTHVARCKADESGLVWPLSKWLEISDPGKGRSRKKARESTKGALWGSAESPLELLSFFFFLLSRFGLLIDCMAY